MLTYAEAGAASNKSRTGRPKLAGNTYLHGKEEGFAVSFHGTEIVRILPDGSYWLNAGGHKTVTTKARIREFSPGRVYSQDGEWWVEWAPFRDGMRVDGHGTPIPSFVLPGHEDAHPLLRSLYQGDRDATGPLLDILEGAGYDTADLRALSARKATKEYTLTQRIAVALDKAGILSY